MKLRPEHVSRLENFLERIKSETYPEAPTALHSQITQQALSRLWPVMALPAGAHVLDVGCGQGVALEEFKSRGCDAIGITLNAVDAQECRRKGYDAREMDQSFLDFSDGSFDLIWCRHCIEHSVFPFFTLSEFARTLKAGGWLYIEVPTSDTSCNHQKNINHYSVLGKSMWAELIQRSGFRLFDIVDVQFTLDRGPDVYWAFIQQKI
jgi:SAM-dependent methyltransferase